MNKRKTVLFLLSVLLAGWAVYSCSMDELEAPAFEDSGRYGGFGAREARAYFEANATDLSVPCFDPKPGSKSSWRDNIELIPEWGEAIETGHSAVSLIEVPLKSYTDNIGKEIRVENGEYGKDHQQELTRRLIIARHDTCQTDMFIITIVPSMDYGGDVVKSVEDFRYLGGGDFTGYVFCSTLEGVFVKAFEYVGGRYVGVANATPASRTKKLWQEHPELFEDVRIFRFQELPRLSQKTYTKSSDWPSDWCSHGFPPGGCFICASGSGSSSGGNTGDSGSSNRCEHGLSPGSCSICNGGGITRCQHGNNIETCSLCNPIVDYGDLDEVIVSSKDYCKDCGNRLEQCICKCDGCKRLKRFCNCHIYPPDSGKDDENKGEEEVSPGTGGSGVLPGTGEGNDGSTIVKQPTPLYDKDQYLDYYKKRIEDFKERYPDKEPPSYYEFYGDFYMHEFLDKTKSCLSPEGQKWVDDVLLLLQEEMEKMLFNIDNVGIELDEEKFLDAAFDTHVEAYARAGICKLSFTDKVFIAMTVYPVDLFQSRGLEQVAKIGVKQIAHWITNPSDAKLQYIEYCNNKESYQMLMSYYLLFKQDGDPRKVPTKAADDEWSNMTPEELFDLLFGEQIRYLEKTFGNELLTTN